MPATAIAGRFAFRATPRDLQNIEIIAAEMRRTGHTFATRSDAIRLCLEAATRDLSAVTAGQA